MGGHSRTSIEFPGIRAIGEWALKTRVASSCDTAAMIAYPVFGSVKSSTPLAVTIFLRNSGEPGSASACSSF